ncbi:hypothetical protein CTM88_06715 [Photobacterium aquimaris]|uniref:Uncharacterized protein n=1 Tax=Photobacterium aquimaris TaxID=512643 RepID=A0A2T3IMR7_9GAMM|nr:hypothetical protein [Photobacterium aquimaris]OBU14755.1 hypothetical protein AYY20_07755 [Photobacterium aquimaris]PSU29638.1 hypothetical protein CTM88_06715 [Photobacterium aquimaris]
MNDYLKCQLSNVVFSKHHLSLCGYNDKEEVIKIQSTIEQFVDSLLTITSFTDQIEQEHNTPENPSQTDIDDVINDTIIMIVTTYRKYLHSQKKGQKYVIDSFNAAQRNAIKTTERSLKQANERYKKQVTSILEKNHSDIYHTHDTTVEGYISISIPNIDNNQTIELEVKQPRIFKYQTENKSIIDNGLTDTLDQMTARIMAKVKHVIPHKNQTATSIFFDDILSVLKVVHITHYYIPDTWFSSLNILGFSNAIINNYNRRSIDRLTKIKNASYK